jgi:hypothetical protein
MKAHDYVLLAIMLPVCGWILVLAIDAALA